MLGRSAVLVTGASGFVGKAVSNKLFNLGIRVKHAVREQTGQSSSFVVGNISTETDWLAALANVDYVIHCAARAYIMNETESKALKAYRAVNVAGTRRLAEQAAEMGVRRLIYLSSIKVNGEQTVPGDRFATSGNALPQDAYGISKWEAEEALHEVSEKTGLEVVIIRPPLVYGPGVKGNFLSMLGWLSRGVPLPLGAIYNQRSFVGIDNLVDLIITCIDHPAATNQTFLVSDDEDLSTTELLFRLGAALGKPARLLPVPASFLKLAARLVGKQDIARRLLGNLQIDISKTREILNWAPPVSVDEGLKRTADWYLKSNE